MGQNTPALAMSHSRVGQDSILVKPRTRQMTPEEFKSIL